MLVEPLALEDPIAGFNGGVITDPGMTVLQQRLIPEDLVLPVTGLMRSFGLDVWVYRGADWYVPHPDGPHVAREAWTVQFEPKVMTRIEDLAGQVAKIVGVSEHLRRPVDPRHHARTHSCPCLPVQKVGPIQALVLVAHCKALEARGPIASSQRRAAGSRRTPTGPRRASISSSDPAATGPAPASSRTPAAPIMDQ